MFFKLLSDVHLEFYDLKKTIKLINNMRKVLKNNKDNGILILAGDIGLVNNNYEFSKYKMFINNFKDYFTKIILIGGNHEYYNSSIDYTDAKLKLLEEEIDNLYYLDNKIILENDYVICGTTLWGDAKDLTFKKSINDFHKIYDFKINPEYYCTLHTKNKIWLENTYNEYKSTKNIIVITHHQPSYKLIDEKYKKYEHLNSFYTASLDYLFDNSQNKKQYFLYGHTHAPKHDIINNINFICNPYGYPGENNDVHMRYFKEFEI